MFSPLAELYFHPKFDPISTAPALALSGTALGFSYAQTRNLLTPITIHALWNSGVILLLTFLQVIKICLLLELFLSACSKLSPFGYFGVAPRVRYKGTAAGNLKGRNQDFTFSKFPVFSLKPDLIFPVYDLSSLWIVSSHLFFFPTIIGPNHVHNAEFQLIHFNRQELS